jgi:sec-independent protein translocase protein TatA
MLGLKPPELILILVLVILLFGGKKLPQLGAGIGEAIRGFKRAVSGADEIAAQAMAMPEAKALLPEAKEPAEQVVQKAPEKAHA